MQNTTAMMLNPDGSCYHLHAHPEDIASTVIFVGDPKRTAAVAQHFDEIEVEKSHREFVLKTGYIQKTRLSVISTGIGSSNIDIVLNELDMLVNMDFNTQKPKDQLTQLNIIRLGTSGSLQADIPVDSLVISSFAFSFGDLLYHYNYHANADEKELLTLLKAKLALIPAAQRLYVSQANQNLLKTFAPLGVTGITFTASGFYAPQGRALRTPICTPNIITQGNQFNSPFGRITNIEMETAAIYSLGRLLGHHCCSISTIVANRIHDKKSKDVDSAIAKMIAKALELITS